MISNFTDDVHWNMENNIDMETAERVSSSSQEIQMEPPVTSTTNMEGLSIVPIKSTMKRPYNFNSRPVHPIKIPALGSMWSNKPSNFPYSSFDGHLALSKHPVSLLNEKFPNIIYKLESVDGPSHCPNFIVTVTVMDKTYTGLGRNKREARAAAALNCLNSIKAAQSAVQLPLTSANQDFASDADAVRAVCGDFGVPFVKTTATEVNSTVTPAKPRTAAEKLLMAINKVPIKNDKSPKLSSVYGSSVKIGKSPINVLYESYKNVTFECASSNEDPLSTVNANQRFKMVCSVLGHKYEGYGASKKLAKLASARSALAILREQRNTSKHNTSSSAVSSSSYIIPNSTREQDDESTPMANRIGKLIVDKFTELIRLDPSHSKRKVLAGIVMTDSSFPNQFEVIGVSTGTKCVNGDHMSAHGMVMNDCHAEVISRRCFMMHLYNQLRMYAESDDPRRDISESDLEPFSEGEWVGYRLRPSKSVHLYISTAPCGDSRIFSPHEEQVYDKHPNRLARGQLRNKIESGEGTIPLIRNSQNFRQTWDGVIEGERLLTMSCSDKVARWNFLGLQGSLLSLFIQPIYLDTVVLGSLLHRPHLSRALYGRLETHNGNWVEPLPPPLPFRPQRPSLMRSSTTAELRMTIRAPIYSMSWTKGQAIPEIVNAATGTTEAGHAPRLCKQAMFSRWVYIAKKIPIASYTRSESRTPCDNVEELIYAEVKEIATLYQKAKICLYTAFERANLGRWVKKPIEQDQFPCSTPHAQPQELFA